MLHGVRRGYWRATCAVVRPRPAHALWQFAFLSESSSEIWASWWAGERRAAVTSGQFYPAAASAGGGGGAAVRRSASCSALSTRMVWGLLDSPLPVGTLNL